MILIMDGYGMNDDEYGNAIAHARKPGLDAIFEKYPSTRLDACGPSVGLPDGQMGNSEVGHLNIGAGRVVHQELSRITGTISDGSFFENRALLGAIEKASSGGNALHLFGLLSEGGVHSHIDHLFALLDLGSRYLDRIYVHCFLDGRDVPPRCALTYIEKLEEKLASLGKGRIATVEGRYYAMDRDKRWERVQQAYDAIAFCEGLRAPSAKAAVEMAYERDENDEFVRPTVVEGAAPVSDGDAVVMFNFRPDRAREITRAFVDPDFNGFDRRTPVSDLSYVTMTEYHATMPNVEVAFPPETYKNTLGEYLSSLGLSQLRIAETEKYAHVTFFFNGGVEEPNKGEDRILVPSPKVATYDLKPEMSAFEVTEKVLEQIRNDKYDVIILNFANPDMVGHTGIMAAAVKAIETIDRCVPKIADAVLEKGGQILLTADHGNADVMLDGEGKPVTAHSLNKVPLVHISNEPRELADGGRLCDIAPTLLELMDLKIPEEMTGRSLIK